MADPLWLGLALSLLVLGVVGSLAPLVPGPLCSVAGVLVYWWHTGYAVPGVGFVAAVLVVGTVAVLADWFAGAVAATASGGATASGVAAVGGGLLGAVLAGPGGLVVGVALAVFAVEVAVTRDPVAGLRASLYATLGLLASAVTQVLVTVGVLLGFLLTLAA